MNSDPHESAAWRAFGMLDADEAAAFDEAMRHDPELKNAYREMECLTAVVAATATVPIPPRAGQLESLHLRLGINSAKRTNWLGISGWAAAALLTVILIIDHKPRGTPAGARNNSPSSPAIARRHEVIADRSSRSEPSPDRSLDAAADKKEVDADHESGDSMALVPPPVREAIVRVETKPLIREIEVLREKLETLQERDQERLETIPGMAWPIVMRLSPPRSSGAQTLLPDAAPITELLGDALTAARGGVASEEKTAVAEGQVDLSAEPSAIPIYDPARRAGTLVVNNLPATNGRERYNLWAKTKNGEVYIGGLPDSGAGKTESYDFSMDPNAQIPTGFTVTKDLMGQPLEPTPDNTILQGPSLK